MSAGHPRIALPYALFATHLLPRATYALAAVVVIIIIMTIISIVIIISIHPNTSRRTDVWRAQHGTPAPRRTKGCR